MLYLIGTIILFFLLYYRLFKKVIYIETVSAAIVMAIGVFSLNVAPRFAMQNIWLKWMAFIAITIWAFFMVSYIFSFISRDFKKLHYNKVIGRFRIGTWIASTSVTVIMISKYFPLFEQSILPLVLFNSILWLLFFLITIQSILSIFMDKLGKNVSGILFLTTVSTQSLLLMYNNVWADFYQLVYINEMLIAIGFLFYLVCVTLIIARYIKYPWNLLDDWKAPNCMFHGALSILGSAIVMAGSFRFEYIFALWCVVLFIFVTHEIIEIIRGVLRTKEYGFIEGLCVYHPSQWSRIFTFCMFYTFTLKFNTNFTIPHGWVMYSQQAILVAGKWLIAILLIIEIGLLLQSLFQKPERLDTAVSTLQEAQAK